MSEAEKRVQSKAVQRILEAAAKKAGAGKDATGHALQVMQRGTALSDDFVQSPSEQLRQSDDVQGD